MRSLSRPVAHDVVLPILPGMDPLLDIVGLAGLVFDFEDHFHVVGTASAALPLTEVARVRGRDEVIVLARLELHVPWSRGESPEGNGEDNLLTGFVADSHHPGIRIGDPAGVIILTVDIVDDVLLLFAPRH